MKIKIESKKYLIYSLIFFLLIFISLFTLFFVSNKKNDDTFIKIVICKENINCPSQMKCEREICVDVGCVKEGYSIPGAISPESRDHLPTKCCEGLVLIEYYANFDENCDYAYLDGGPGGICSKCGNGICDPWETKCTCEDDCIGSITL